jgi:hypothetical protein
MFTTPLSDYGKIETAEVHKNTSGDQFFTKVGTLRAIFR